MKILVFVDDFKHCLCYEEYEKFNEIIPAATYRVNIKMMKYLHKNVSGCKIKKIRGKPETFTGNSFFCVGKNQIINFALLHLLDSVFYAKFMV